MLATILFALFTASAYAGVLPAVIGRITFSTLDQGPGLVYLTLREGRYTVTDRLRDATPFITKGLGDIQKSITIGEDRRMSWGHASAVSGPITGYFGLASNTSTPINVNSSNYAQFVNSVGTHKGDLPKAVEHSFVARHSWKAQTAIWTTVDVELPITGINPVWINEDSSKVVEPVILLCPDDNSYLYLTGNLTLFTQAYGRRCGTPLVGRLSFTMNMSPYSPNVITTPSGMLSPNVMLSPNGLLTPASSSSSNGRTPIVGSNPTPYSSSSMWNWPLRGSEGSRRHSNALK